MYEIFLKTLHHVFNYVSILCTSNYDTYDSGHRHLFSVFHIKKIMPGRNIKFWSATTTYICVKGNPAQSNDNTWQNLVMFPARMLQFYCYMIHQTAQTMFRINVFFNFYMIHQTAQTLFRISVFFNFYGLRVKLFLTLG